MTHYAGMNLSKLERDTIAIDVPNEAIRVSGTVTTSSSADEESQYILQDVDEASSTLTYLGKLKNDGKWLIVKIDSTSGATFRFANESNNSSYSDYSTAFTNRTTLTYELLEELSDLWNLKLIRY